MILIRWVSEKGESSLKPSDCWSSDPLKRKVWSPVVSRCSSHQAFWHRCPFLSALNVSSLSLQHIKCFLGSAPAFISSLTPELWAHNLTNVEQQRWLKWISLFRTPERRCNWSKFKLMVFGAENINDFMWLKACKMDLCLSFESVQRPRPPRRFHAFTFDDRPASWSNETRSPIESVQRFLQTNALCSAHCLRVATLCCADCSPSDQRGWVLSLGVLRGRTRRFLRRSISDFKRKKCGGRPPFTFNRLWSKPRSSADIISPPLWIRLNPPPFLLQQTSFISSSFDRQTQTALQHLLSSSVNQQTVNPIILFIVWFIVCFMNGQEMVKNANKDIQTPKVTSSDCLCRAYSSTHRYSDTKKSSSSSRLSSMLTPWCWTHADVELAWTFTVSV